MQNKLKIVVMTHGNLGEALIEASSMFFRVDSSVVCLGLYEEDAISEYQQRVEKETKGQQDILILTDMVSAATTRVAAQALKNKNVETISGVNLVMLLTAMRERDSYSLIELAELVRTTACEDIVNIRKRLCNDREEREICTIY